MAEINTSWFVYGNSEMEQRNVQRLLDVGAPPWRDFNNTARRSSYEFQIGDVEKQIINAALYLRRPLLVTGEPGTGKSSLAYSIAEQLDLGKVLVWPITSRATLNDALYRYDAIGRLQAANLARDAKQASEAPRIEYFMTLGPLGTALADSKEKPRVLLIDEIDKSDIDLPNDLLHIFEEGEFEIPELVRLGHVEKQSKNEFDDMALDNSRQDHKAQSIRKFDGSSMDDTVEIINGHVRCNHFPIVIMTSNGERELPAPFLRRCLQLPMKRPDKRRLEQIILAHFGEQMKRQSPQWQKVEAFIDYIYDRQRANDYIAPEQLLNAVHLVLTSTDIPLTVTTRGDGKEELSKTPELTDLAKTVMNVISKLRER